MYGVTFTNNGSIISSSSGRQIDWMDGTVFEASVTNPSAVYIVILFDCTNPKTTLLIVPLTQSPGSFQWLASLKCHSDCTDLSKFVINTNTYLVQHCDEHPSLHKMTLVDEFFIRIFNSLTMTLVQLNEAVREWSLGSLITAIDIFVRTLCSASR